MQRCLSLGSPTQAEFHITEHQSALILKYLLPQSGPKPFHFLKTLFNFYDGQIQNKMHSVIRVIIVIPKIQHTCDISYSIHPFFNITQKNNSPPPKKMSTSISRIECSRGIVPLRPHLAVSLFGAVCNQLEQENSTHHHK